MDAALQAIARKRNGKTTREKFLSGATCVPAAQGHNDVSLRQVYTKAEIDHVSMSCQYGTRKSLLLDIFERGRSTRSGDEIDRRSRN